VVERHRGRERSPYRKTQNKTKVPEIQEIAYLQYVNTGAQMALWKNRKPTMFL
jgi:hypothetical protein